MQSDSRPTFLWRAPGIHYTKENFLEQHRYDVARLLALEGKFLRFSNSPHDLSWYTTCYIIRDILQPWFCVRLLRGTMGEDLFPMCYLVSEEPLKKISLAFRIASLFWFDLDWLCIARNWVTVCWISYTSWVSLRTSKSIDF